ncbi:MAG: hypothetical protein ACPGJS_19405, partial [Flammeovirgaceae bacterium]
EKTTIMNPPAEGFNLAESDEKAIQIADRVMEAMGGRKNWDDTRFIQWTFFGRRDLYWDKKEGRVRIEIPEKEMVMLVNVFDNTGKIQVAGEELTEPDSITKYVQQAKSIWINDSYWLVMPFKLKDSGVTLKYLREDTTTVGQLADVLELTFTGVGDTPENKYEVFVDKESNLVTQWDFYRTVKDTKAQFKTPWANYKTYGKVKLSGNRGNYHLNNIAVLETMDDAVFTDFAPLTP